MTTPYHHSCFISYKHPPVPEHDYTPSIQHFWLQFIRAFEARLQSFLTVGLPIYRDEQLRSAPGTHYPAELSTRLCRSACMIAILVPEYMESGWCKAEWKAMEELEKARNLRVGHEGAIIPVLFRGDESKIKDFCGTRTFVDFRWVNKPSTQLNKEASLKTIERIAVRIAELATHHSASDCERFKIQAGEEVVDPGFDDPDPLA